MDSSEDADSMLLMEDDALPAPPVQASSPLHIMQQVRSAGDTICAHTYTQRTITHGCVYMLVAA